jgi:dipeptidyl-peptidase-2
MLALVASTPLGIPATPQQFTQQLVDHFGAGNSTYSQRYYSNTTSFGGRGHPIFVIMGGEGAIPPEVGLFYPFVVDVLAPKFRAMVIEPEHRFYGTSLPFGAASYDPENMRLLTPQQALADAVVLTRAIQRAHNCSTRRGDAGYCPVITFGGSYPGWLSAMMRLRYPFVVDGAYAASAPMKFYAQQVEQHSYYQVVTRSAERAVAGCSAAVSSALQLVASATDPHVLSSKLSLCASTLPDYIRRGGVATLRDELLMVYSYTFAGLNMGNYPPGPTTGLAFSCGLFVKAMSGGGGGSSDDEDKRWAALREFLARYSYFGKTRPVSLVSAASAISQGAGAGERRGGCFDMSAQLPSGPNGTISCGDWSGCGVGDNGRSWDFQTCTFLIEAIGTNGVSDMFPPRSWSIEWLREHCSARFGVRPAPTRLVDEWGFDAVGLRAQGASRILFTNGLNDGWSAGGFQQNVSDERELIVLNMPNGAHHSDLRHTRPCPGPDDTSDVLETRAAATSILQRWLAH